VNRRKKVLLRGVGIVSLFCFVFVCTCILQSWLQSWRAERFFETISTFRPGISSEVDTLIALRNFGPGATLTQVGEPLVSRTWHVDTNTYLEAQGRSYHFSNTGLRFLHLVDRKSIDGVLYFRQGVLVAIYAWQFESGNPECWVRVRGTSRSFDDSVEPSNGQKVSIRAQGGLSFLTVDVYSNAAQQDRSNAYALNPRRLVSLTNCRDARALIPQ
jgi:hypothetical protein